MLACALGASGAITAVASATEPPRAQLVGFACHPASDALDRWVSVTAVMRPVSGTERMALKFNLQRMTPHSSSFVNVHGGDLGQWRYPTGAGGRVLDTAVRLSPRCSEPG
jgi:hypothetical protein